MAHSGLQPRSVCCHSLDPDNWSTTCQLSFSKQSPLKALLFVFQMLALPAPAHVPCPAFFSLSVATLGLWILPGPWPTWLPQLHLLLRLAGCSLASSPSSVIKTSRQGWGPSPATASLPLKTRGVSCLQAPLQPDSRRPLPAHLLVRCPVLSPA